MSSSSRPRFIAGAVCPRCGEMDRIVVHGDEAEATRECVACGFSDAQPADTPDAGVPSGRLDKPRPRPEATPAQPIRFYPRKPRDGDD